ncbi:hypothetical protein MTP99_004744 [Tenebrio molitor]|jgi:hypothetical protein|nr:hypothetical protein MTP99_004744 [Tenebrio molitor]
MAFPAGLSLLREILRSPAPARRDTGQSSNPGKISPPGELRLQLAGSTIESDEQSLDSSPSVFRSGHPIDQLADAPSITTQKTQKVGPGKYLCQNLLASEFFAIIVKDVANNSL